MFNKTQILDEFYSENLITKRNLAFQAMIFSRTKLNPFGHGFHGGNRNFRDLTEKSVMSACSVSKTKTLSSVLEKIIRFRQSQAGQFLPFTCVGGRPLTRP